MKSWKKQLSEAVTIVVSRHPDEMADCFRMVTETNFAIMGLSDYGLREGALASLVVLDAGDPVEALRLRAPRLAVISKGRVISRAARADGALSIPDRPARVTRRHRAPRP